MPHKSPEAAHTAADVTAAEALTPDEEPAGPVLAEKKETAPTTPAAPVERPEVVETAAGAVESAFAPEVPHEDIANGILAANGGSDVTGDRPARRGRPVGTKSRTMVRKVVPVAPKPTLPSWWVEHGVLLREDCDPAVLRPKLEFYRPPEVDTIELEAFEGVGEEVVATTTTTTTITTTTTTETVADAATETTATETATVETTAESTITIPAAATETVAEESIVEDVKETPAPTHRYQIHEPVWEEILSTVRTGLLLPKGAFVDGLASTKSHCLLFLPKDGGLYYLDAVAEKLAVEVGADLVRIDAQDLAEIGGDYLGDSRHGEDPPTL